ncbi:MAG: gamma-glutamylcyclotransferase [Sporichthyaceae bacterium]
MALYAAYGKNLDPALMALIAPHSPQRGTGWLVGWRLTFGGEEHGGEGARTTVVEAPDQQVFVALYDVTSGDEHALDGWEGSAPGFYTKIRVRVATLDGEELAWLYVVDGYEGGLPTAHVVFQIADAAERAGAPADYVRWLRERPCRSVGM